MSEWRPKLAEFEALEDEVARLRIALSDIADYCTVRLDAWTATGEHPQRADILQIRKRARRSLRPVPRRR